MAGKPAIEIFCDRVADAFFDARPERVPDIHMLSRDAQVHRKSDLSFVPCCIEFIPVDRAHKVYGAKDTVIRTLICFTAERMTISGIDHRLMRAGF
jgi:hypothetical protein